MQDIYKKIFEMATQELPDRHQTFNNEEAVLFKGFKISKSNDVYKWEDTRYSNYYEPVDPKVTENVLENGFSVTLTEVMLHNDLFKIDKLKREIEIKDSLISHWVGESTKLYNDYVKKRNSINKDKKLKDEVKEERKKKVRKRYEKSRDLFQKKRRVITEEREELKSDLKFFESRIRLYN